MLAHITRPSHRLTAERWVAGLAWDGIVGLSPHVTPTTRRDTLALEPGRRVRATFEVREIARVGAHASQVRKKPELLLGRIRSGPDADGTSAGCKCPPAPCARLVAPRLQGAYTDPSGLQAWRSLGS